MFANSVVKALVAQGTFWAVVVGLVVVAWVVFRTAETANRILVRIPIPKLYWPRLPKLRHIAWERVSEPTKKVATQTIAVVGVVTFGVLTPLYLALGLTRLVGVADPVAYTAAGVLLSAVVVSGVGLFLLVKPASRASVREIGLQNAVVLYAIAISWLAMIIAGLPLALLSD